MSITWNPSDIGSGLTLSNGNRTITRITTSNWTSVRATDQIPSGRKIYFEIEMDSIASGLYAMPGVCDSGAALGSSGFWSSTQGFGYLSSTGQKFNNGSGTSYGSTFTTADIIGIACDNDKIWWSKNNVWQASGDPAAGTNAAYTSVDPSGNDIFPCLGIYTVGNQATVNFASDDFNYTPPSGFESLEQADEETIKRIVIRGVRR